MFERYAIYFTPTGALAQVGAAWLGWDVAEGCEVTHPDVPGLDVAALTARPRKYGLHGTVKPPMYLAEGTTAEGLAQAVENLTRDLSPVTLDGLKVSQLGRFLALTPQGSTTELSALAGRVVRELDHFRAPPSEAELARRRQSSLSPAQEEHLANWGYPYVMDQFRFHITLTGPVADAETILPVLQNHFAQVLPVPFVVDSLTLVGQAAHGMFQEIARYPLGSSG